ncbi:two-component regulator propeller domain-containing protein [Flavobacterium sp. RSP29]|uniref:two-component regulator propeller domain-containing protein n=1 Tax=Flavobacterium sp. RSP29 TaxID=3401731 RepID=UPI003AAD4686
MDKLYPYQLEKKKILSMLFFKRNNYLVVFLLLFEVAVTQTIPSKNITVNDGLPSNGIKCFFKDSRGLLWIGTDANDIIAGVQIIGGTLLMFTPLAPIGAALIGAGVTHFAATYNEYKQTGDWTSASKNAGVFFNVSFNTDWGYGKDKQNGVTQTETAVNPKTINDDKGNGNQLDPSTIGQNIPLLGGKSTYAGGDNPTTYSRKYTYSYVPTMITDYPAIGHDRRYDNLGITGASGLIFDTRAIGADWKFVSEQFQLLM